MFLGQLPISQSLVSIHFPEDPNLDGFYTILSNHWEHDAGSQPDQAISSSDNEDDAGGAGGEAVSAEGGPPTSSATGVSDATGGNDVHPEEDPFITEAANRIAALKSLSFLLLSFASYLVFTTHRCYIVAILSTQHAHHPESNLQSWNRMFSHDIP